MTGIVSLKGASVEMVGVFEGTQYMFNVHADSRSYPIVADTV